MTFSQMISNLAGPGVKMTRACWKKKYIYYGCLPTDTEKMYPVIIAGAKGRKDKKYMYSNDDLKANDWVFYNK